MTLKTGHVIFILVFALMIASMTLSFGPFVAAAFGIGYGGGTFFDVWLASRADYEKERLKFKEDFAEMERRVDEARKEIGHR